MGSFIFAIIVTALAALFLLFGVFTELPMLFGGELGILEILRFVGFIIVMCVGIYGGIRNTRDSYILKVKKKKLKAPKKSSSWIAAIIGFVMYSPRNNYYEDELTATGQLKVQVLFLLLFAAIIIGLPWRMFSVYGREAFAWPQIIVLLFDLPLLDLAALTAKEILKLRKKLRTKSADKSLQK